MFIICSRKCSLLFLVSFLHVVRDCYGGGGEGGDLFSAPLDVIHDDGDHDDDNNYDNDDNDAGYDNDESTITSVILLLKLQAFFVTYNNEGCVQFLLTFAMLLLYLLHKIQMEAIETVIKTVTLWLAGRPTCLSR